MYRWLKVDMGVMATSQIYNLIKNWIVSILASNLSLIQVEHSIMHPLDGFDCRECQLYCEKPQTLLHWTMYVKCLIPYY